MILESITARSTTDKRRERLLEICLGLPEATSDGERHIAFRVRGRTFAYYLVDHHGDGRVALNCKVAPGDQDVLLRMDPARYFVPAYLGAKGWIGQRLDLADIDWSETAQLISDSYLMVAPKRLAAALPGSQS